MPVWLERRTGHVAMNDQELTCEEVLEQLFAFLDGELESHFGQRIERHLHQCRCCFPRAEFERRLRARVRETGTAAAPERLRERVRAALERY